MTEKSYAFLVGVTKKSIALLFCKYIETQGVSCKIEEIPEGFAILCDETLLPQAETLWSEFRENPHAAKYQQSAWSSSETESLNEDGSSLLNIVSPFIAHAGIVTLTVFCICWVAFLASEFGFKKEVFQLLHFYGNFNVDAFLHEPHRLITAAFFHFSWLHIAFNTMWWWQLGGEIEKTLGKFTLVSILFLSAVLSNVGQFYSTGPLFGGLSGVVYALVGYVWWMGWLVPKVGLSLSKPIVGFLLFWLLLGFIDVLPVNMANIAHTLGLVCGCLLAWIKSLQLNHMKD